MINLNNKLIAHRGVFNNINIPENSLLSFKKSIDMNLPIELDVMLTSDNKLVVFHDFNLSRMTGKDLFLEYVTYDELNRLNLLDTKEKIPNLKDVLELVDGKVVLDIEIKCTKNYKKICQEVAKILDNYKHDFFVQSFDPKIIRWFKKNRKEYLTGLIIMDKYFFVTKWLIDYCKPNILVVYKKNIKEKFFQHIRKKYPLIAWTIKKEKELENYEGYADAYICNNIQYYNKNHLKN